MAPKAKPTRGKPPADTSEERPIDDGKPIKITLLHGRGRHLGWVLFGGIAGGLLLWRFGSIGQALGLLLLAIAIQQGYRLAQTVLHAAGTFQVDGENVLVPTGLCSGAELKLQRSQIDHVFFLRRSVPWTQAGPLLIIETEGKSYSFPRDWFASDSDQRRVEMALNRQLKLNAAA
ncbi:MAG: hypothetical protein GY811_14170 [Myxococcales bacterium]|nr:hypothetical protein [Myxococcales bacterium]